MQRCPQCAPLSSTPPYRACFTLRVFIALCRTELLAGVLTDMLPVHMHVELGGEDAFPARYRNLFYMGIGAVLAPPARCGVTWGRMRSDVNVLNVPHKVDN